MWRERLVSRRTCSSPVLCSMSSTSTQFLSKVSYSPPSWCTKLKPIPSERYVLGMLPTPIHPWNLPGVPEGVEVWIKRDDLSGMQLSGNKVRKLEFLLAEAKADGHDCVVTIGGVQSNHCRATAVAARYLGLGCHLVLRTSRQAAQQDPQLAGNLLVDRLAGAQLHMVTKEEYAAHGSQALLQRLAQQLAAQGRKPYLIPVGGSNALGSWGYLQAAEEVRQQAQQLGLQFTDVAMACGSGGTAAGLALGCHMSGLGARVHAFGVCDDPEYFYNFIDGILEVMGAGREVVGAGAREMLLAVQAKGIGYALSREEELHTVKDIAAATGIILDPVYSGKAAHYMLQEMQQRPEAWRGRRVLFLHTGGLLGLYDKVDQLQPLLEAEGHVSRMQL